MILRAIATADVVALAFPRLQRTLVADLRPIMSDRPALFVAPPLPTATQVLAALEAHRSERAVIERYAQVVWGGSMRAFAEQGILPALLDRLSADAGQDAMAVFEELQELEGGLAGRAPRPRVP
jgi:hypothetical protein